MQISGVSTWVVDAGDRDWVFVRVDTDEPGLFGWGESSLGWHTRAVVGAVGDLEPMLIGQDPRPVERLWQTMIRGPFFKGGAVVMSAISGIDQALWDIKAKALGVPLFELLGGPVRDRVRTYVNLGSELGGDARDPEAWADAAREARKAGFDAMKVYPAMPARPLEGTAFLRETETLVAVVRDAAGEDADVMVDLHGRTVAQPWRSRSGTRSRRTVRRGSRNRASRGTPTRWQRSRARSRSRSPPASGSWNEGRSPSCSTNGRARSSQPNVCYCGGVSEFRRIASLAETALTPVAPHNPNGPIGTMVSVHLALALSNVPILEHVRGDVPWRDEIVDEPFVTTDGYANAPTRPGIGVELVEEVAAAHVGGSPPPHLAYAPDGSLLDW